MARELSSRSSAACAWRASDQSPAPHPRRSPLRQPAQRLPVRPQRRLASRKKRPLLCSLRPTVVWPWLTCVGALFVLVPATTVLTTPNAVKDLSKGGKTLRLPPGRPATASRSASKCSRTSVRGNLQADRRERRECIAQTTADFAAGEVAMQHRFRSQPSRYRRTSDWHRCGGPCV